jgi:hypothetical protein
MLQELLIRVHGVATLEEAVRLESMGVNLISAVVGAHASERVIGPEAAKRISGALMRACLCVESSSGDLIGPDAARHMGASLVAVPWGRAIPRAWREDLVRLGMSWALVRVPADEDDDPSWIQSRIVEAGDPKPAWIEVEICPNLEDGWSVINSPHESELDAADLAALAVSHRILYAPSFSEKNVRSIRDTLPHVEGFSLTLLDSKGGVAGASLYSTSEAEKILKQLRQIE